MARWFLLLLLPLMCPGCFGGRIRVDVPNIRGRLLFEGQSISAKKYIIELYDRQSCDRKEHLIERAHADERGEFHVEGTLMRMFPLSAQPPESSREWALCFTDEKGKTIAWNVFLRSSYFDFPETVHVDCELSDERRQHEMDRSESTRKLSHDELLVRTRCQILTHIPLKMGLSGCVPDGSPSGCTPLSFRTKKKEHAHVSPSGDPRQSFTGNHSCHQSECQKRL